MELTLQFILRVLGDSRLKSRNPYFIGINSAIENIIHLLKGVTCRNPYFIGINSAIKESVPFALRGAIVAILILLELTLQFKKEEKCMKIYYSRNPYFIGINSAIVGRSWEALSNQESQSLFYWN